MEADYYRPLGSPVHHRVRLQSRINQSLSPPPTLSNPTGEFERGVFFARDDSTPTDILTIGALELVPPHQCFWGVFIVPNKMGEWRVILNLKDLSLWVQKQELRIEPLNTICQMLQQDGYLTPLDVKEASLHLPVQPSSQQCPRFASRGHHFQCKALPFGLSSSPLVFTEILVVLIAAALRRWCGAGLF